MNAFNADAAIQIYDSTAFASVITRQLPGGDKASKDSATTSMGPLNATLAILNSIS
jgi:hypothetical protein